MGCVSGRPQVDKKKDNKKKRTSPPSRKKSLSQSSRSRSDQGNAGKPVEPVEEATSIRPAKTAPVPTASEPPVPKEQQSPLEQPQPQVRAVSQATDSRSLPLKQTIPKQTTQVAPAGSSISREQILQRYSLKVKDTSHRTPAINSYQYETMLAYNPNVPESDPAPSKGALAPGDKEPSKNILRSIEGRVNGFQITDIHGVTNQSYRMAQVDREKLKSWIDLSDDFYLDPDGLLGKGAFGEVFRGYSVKKDCLIAIKTMEGEGYEREVETLKALSSLNHPNIMGYYGFLEKGSTVYICIQFCPNGTLTDLISEGIEEERVLELFRQMIEGMCYMNAKGKMHRDLKPDNVLLGMKKDVKISDFGLARQTTGIFVTGQMGTPLYAGPEVYLNKTEENYSQKCDVWGAGMILYEMLTGKLLFQGVRTFEDLRKEWSRYETGQRRVEYGKHLHPNWEFFTNYLLTYDPKKRPTFHEVLEKLKKSYEKMKYQINNKVQHEINQNTKIGRLEILLQFFQEKYGILLKIYDALRQQVTSFRPEFKYLMEFLCLCQYVTHIKKLTRSIKYKRVKVNQDDDDDQLYEEKEDFDLLLDKYRNSFEHKYNYYNDQINNQVLPKLQEFAKKPESEPVVTAMKDLWELVGDVADGSFDVEETYSQGLQTVLKSKLEQFHKGLYDNMNEEELRTMNLILVGASLETKLDNQLFLKRNHIRDTLSRIEAQDRNASLKDIHTLKAQLP